MTAELAEALRRAGVAEVDASARRRAEYSTDASLYRVPPELVVFPRDLDESWPWSRPAWRSGSR